MFLSKLKMAPVIVLMLAGVLGVGAGVYHLHAQAPVPGSGTSAGKPVEAAPDKPAAKAAEKEADTLTTLMQERLKLARQEVDVCKRLYQAARVDFDALATASKNLLKAELGLSTKRADRLAAHERYVKMVEGWVKIVRARLDAARTSELELLKAHYLLVDAKIDLEREKARK
jgi:hypothetical protein